MFLTVLSFIFFLLAFQADDYELYRKTVLLLASCGLLGDRGLLG
jgi:hypothetical protein